MSGEDKPQPGAPDEPAEGWHQHPESEPHSWGQVSDRHWSRTRADSNRDAVEHMRGRSRAPGVAEGGGARNSYCMECDGVIPFDLGEGSAKPDACPHCGAALDERVQAMFNWVEIDEAPTGDVGPLLRTALIGFVLLAALVTLLVWSLL